MILLSLVLYYLYGIASTAPTGGVATTSSDSTDGPIICNGADYRSTAQIVTSCISTVLLCTWFTVHPDVCGPGSTVWQRVGRKVELFFWALLMPELVMAWACNQWVGARRVCKKMGKNGSEYKWSMIEGHFLQMGGIVFYNDKLRTALNLRKVVLPRQLSSFFPKAYGAEVEQDAAVEQKWTKESIHRELSDLHDTMGREEIQNQSKSDGLSKTIVLIQTTWFTFQCVARAVQGLALTELENITLAYTVLNGAMCFFWWNKPLDVHCPVVLVLEDGQIKRRAVALFTKRSDPNGAEKERGKWFTRGILWAPLKGVNYLIESAAMFIGANKVADPRFTTWGGDAKALLAISLLAAVFGAIHCISWSFTFPSPALRTIWRTCSMYITFYPLSLVSFPVLGIVLGMFETTFPVVLYILSPLYIVARIILLVVAFWSLSTMPATGHQSIPWANYIPHL